MVGVVNSAGSLVSRLYGKHVEVVAYARVDGSSPLPVDRDTRNAAGVESAGPVHIDSSRQTPGRHRHGHTGEKDFVLLAHRNNREPRVRHCVEGGGTAGRRRRKGDSRIWRRISESRPTVCVQNLGIAEGNHRASARYTRRCEVRTEPDPLVRVEGGSVEVRCIAGHRRAHRRRSCFASQAGRRHIDV